jgi:diguanylate cyclase (GGDEF)-like protein
MKKSDSRPGLRLLAVLSGGIVYYVVFLLFSSVLQFEGKVLQHFQSCSGQKRVVKKPFYTLLKRPESLHLCAVLKGSQDTLILSRLTAHGVRVFENNKLRYKRGTPDKTGNLWYYPHIVQLKNSQLATRQIRIELDGLYDVGLQAIPLATYWKKSRYRILLSQFFFRDFQWLLAGATFMMGGILLLFASFSVTYRRVYWMTGFSALLGGLYLMEFVHFDSMGTLEYFLLWRKLTFAGAVLATLLLLAGMERLVFRRSRFAYVMLVPSVFAVVGLLWQDNLYSLKHFMGIAGVLVLFNPLLTLVIALFGKRMSLISAWSFYSFSLLHSIAVLVFQMDAIFLSNIGIAVSMIGLGLFLMQRYIELHFELAASQEIANTDSLTGAYNRHYLNDLRTCPDDVLVLVDMNNFKYINDNFGHHIGDEMLVQWVKSSKSLLRAEDRVVRLGGDEFLLVLAAPVDSSLEPILERIEDDWRTHFEGMPVSFSYGSEPVGESLHEALERADIKMYAHKKDVKSRRYEVITQEVLFPSQPSQTSASKISMFETPPSHSAIWSSSQEQDFYIEDIPPSEEDEE